MRWTVGKETIDKECRGKERKSGEEARGVAV